MHQSEIVAGMIRKVELCKRARIFYNWVDVYSWARAERKTKIKVSTKQQQKRMRKTRKCFIKSGGYVGLL